MSKATATASGGIGFGGLLCIVLIVLKVLDKIDMNWLLVLTSWFWAPGLVFISFLTIDRIGIGLFWLVAAAFDKWG